MPTEPCHAFIRLVTEPPRVHELVDAEVLRGLVDVVA